MQKRLLKGNICGLLQQHVLPIIWHSFSPTKALKHVY